MKRQNFVISTRKILLIISAITLIMAIVCSVLIQNKEITQEQEPVMSIKILDISSKGEDEATEVEKTEISGKDMSTYAAKHISNDTVYINSENTVELLLSGTDETKYDSSNLTQSDIVVKVGGTDVTSRATISLGAKTETASGVTHTLTLSNLPENGALTIEIAANTLTDAAQNRNGITKFDQDDPNYQEIIVDNTPPVVNFGTNGNTTYARVQSSTVTATDASSGVATNSLKYLWKNNNTTPVESEFTGTFTNGGTVTSSSLINPTGDNYYLWVLAKDNVGNVAITKSNAFYFDSIAPNTPTITAKLNNSSGATYTADTWTKENVYIEVSAIDTHSGIKEYQWYNNGEWTTTDLTTENGIGKLTLTDTRNETLRFKAIDNLDNISAEGTFAVKIDKAAPTISASTITYGENLSITLEDTLSGVAAWQVVAGDGTTAPTSGWTEISATASTTVSKSGLSAGTNTIWAKDYVGNINYQAITVGRQSIELPSFEDKTYNGTAQSISNATEYTVGGTTSGTDAGTYTATVTPTSNYKWSDETTTAKNVDWVINPKSVAVTWGETALTYNGSAQAPTATAASDVANETINLDRTMETDVGSYTSTASISSVTGGQARNENYTLTNTTVEYSIDYSRTATANAANKPYTGSSQTGVTGNHVDWTGDTTGTNPGSYTAYATPQANYAWSDGTRTQRTVTWYITKIDDVDTIVTNATGKSIEITGTEMGQLYVIGISNMSIASASINGTTLTVKGLRNGSTTVTIREQRGGYTLTINVTIDITAPTLANVRALIVDRTSLTLTATGGVDTGGSGLAGYKVYNSSGTLQKSQKSTSATVTLALTSNTGWYSDNYVVKAYDNAGNETTTGVGISYYNVSTENGLIGLATAVNSGGTFAGRTVHQIADITMTASNFVPIGKDASHKFLGTYFGGYETTITKVNRTITNLTVNVTSGAYAGLFGYIGVSGSTGGEISYITLADADVKILAGVDLTSSNTSAYTGAIVGRIDGSSTKAAKIDHCTTTNSEGDSPTKGVRNYAKIDANCYTFAGGFAGYAGYAQITNCTNNNFVYAIYASDIYSSLLSRAGGIVGTLNENNSAITSCTNNGYITGRYAVGGIVGQTNGRGTSSVAGLTISSCTNNGTVREGAAAFNTDGDMVYYGTGGIAGGISLNDRITSSSNTGSVTSYQANELYNGATGGIVGRNSGGIIGGGTSATKCTNSGTITCKVGCDAGGIVGFNQVGQIYYAQNTGIVTGEGSGVESTFEYAIFGGIAGYNYGGSIKNCTNSGNVSSTSSSYGIVGGIVGLNKGFNESDYPDIDWINGDYGAYINNCTNTGNVSGKDKIGGIIGENDSNGVVVLRRAIAQSKGAAMADTCTVQGSATITGGDRVGGIIGYNNSGNLFTCTYKSSGTITGTTKVGGVVGENSSYIREGKHTSGNVKGTSSIGGVSGTNSGKIFDSTCSGGTISSTVSNGNLDYAGLGGISGYNSSTGYVGYCISSTTIELSGNTGGIVGNNQGVIDSCRNSSTTVAGKSGDYCGGIAGRNFGTIRKCSNKNLVNYANGNVIDTNINAVGGIAGINRNTIENCYNRYIVGGKNNIGGIVGRNLNNGSVTATIDHCYDTANVKTSQTSQGAIVGLMSSGSTTQCKYLTTLTNTSGEGTPATIAELKTLPAQSGWEFLEVDYKKINGGYPVLLWEYDDEGEDFSSSASTPTDTIYYVTTGGTVNTSTANTIKVSGSGGMQLYIPDVTVSTKATITSGSVNYIQRGNESNPIIYKSGENTSITGRGRAIITSATSSSSVSFYANGKSFVEL